MSKAELQFVKRVGHMVYSDNDITVPTPAEISDYFSLAENTENLEAIGNRRIKDTYFKRNMANNFSDAANWATLQELNDFLVDY